MVTLTPIGTTSNSLKTILIDNRGDAAATTTCLQGISTESLSQAMTTQQPSTGHQYITVTQNASTCLYPTIEICQCSNPMVNYTKEEILEKTQRLVSELKVDKKGASLGLYNRRSSILVYMYSIYCWGTFILLCLNVMPGNVVWFS